MNSRKYLIIFVLILFSFANRAFAERVKVYNLSFDYTVTSEIDSQQKVIKIGDYSKVVQIKDLDKFLTNYYFFNSDNSFSFLEIRDFAKSSIAEKTDDLTFLALKKIISDRATTFSQAEEFFSLLTEDFIAEAARKDQFELDYKLSKKTNAGKYFLILTSEKYSLGFLRNCCSEAINLIPAISFYIQRQLASGLTTDELLSTFYNKNKVIFTPQTLKNLEKILQYLNTLAGLDDNFAKTYQQFQKNFPEYFSSLDSLLSALKNQAFEKLISQSNFKAAFDIILLSQFEERNEEIHQQIKTVLESLDLGFAPILLIDPYKSYLKQISEKDFQIKDLMINTHEDIVKGLTLANKIFEAQEYLLEVLSYRPNPNKQNTKLIFFMIKALDEVGLDDQVYLMLNTYQLDYSWGQKFWFLKKGYYFSLYFVWLFLVLVIALAILVRMKIIDFSRYQTAFNQMLERLGIKRTFTVKSKAHFNKHFDQLNSERQKYKSLLKYFELTESASLDQIKSRYRKKVKAYHPDINPNQSELDKTRFLEISERYDDLIELYERFQAK